MTAYYNEIDPQKAAWLRELISRDLVAPGEVDERSIADVRPDDLRGYTQCHFFAGIGIWSYALRLAGWPDDREAWSGSCPCPSFSAAGKGQGFDDPRHLWPHWFGLIRECLPPVCFGEQVDDAIGHGWLDLVQTDLEGKAYAVGKAVLGACSVGAPHIRQRLYFCADNASPRLERNAGSFIQGGIEGFARGGDALGGPEPMHSERRALLLDGLDGCDGPDGGRQEAHGELGAHGEVRDRLFTDQPGLEIGVGASELRGPGLPVERRSEAGDVRDSQERGQPVCGSPSGIARHAALTGATRGFWKDCDWWYGKDGKYRPIGCGISPLIGAVKRGVFEVADVTAGDLRLLRNQGLSEPETSEARVMRLKGYGDGIVAEVAAEFIRAYMEARNVS